MSGFLRKYLDPADRLGEILFGLIMALGIVGAVRLAEEEVSKRSLFIAVLGCNLAWAVVDAVMYVLVALFESGRRARLARKMVHGSSDAEALAVVRGELDPQLEHLASAEARTAFYADILKTVRTSGEVRPSLSKEDLLGGVAVALVILLATFPILVPFLVVADTTTAVRCSEGISVAGLFLLGWWWGRVVGTNPWKVGILLTLIGGLLVGLTILLGG